MERAEPDLDDSGSQSSGDVSPEPEVGCTTERLFSQMERMEETELQRAGLQKWIEGLQQGADLPFPMEDKDDVMRVSMATTYNSRKLLPVMEEEEEEEEAEAKPTTTSRLPAILPTITLGFTAEGLRGKGEGNSLLHQPRVPKKLVPVVAGFRVER